jgi:PAS domain S-box-containing protein
MANFTPQVVWTASADGTITFANDRWYAYSGLTPEQTVLGWPRLVLHPDDYDRCLHMWGDAIRDGTEYEIEVRIRRRDGEYRWWLTRATPIKDASGNVNSWFGSSTDIHDMKMAQQSAGRKRGSASPLPARGQLGGLGTGPAHPSADAFG